MFKFIFKQQNLHIKAFSLAEMMIVMLILSIVLAAAMPIITHRVVAGEKNSEEISKDSSLPVGSIIWYAATTPPEGFLECNGQSTSGHSELAKIVGSNVPDLRGEFIRGWDNGRGIEPGRPFASWEIDSTINHKHYQGAGEEFPTLGYYANTTWRNNSTTGGTPRLAWTSGMFDMSGNALSGSTETRPRNLALLPCIKY